jgi:hypothetical protein
LVFYGISAYLPFRMKITATAPLIRLRKLRKAPCQFYAKVIFMSLDALCKLTLSDMRIVVLGLISCCFEGTMYLFIFFWSPALKSALEVSHPSESQAGTIRKDLPFGIIFATFMSAMMLGSLGFSVVTSKIKNSGVDSVSMLATAIVGSSISLLVTVFAKSEVITLWCFCVFEMCVGVYYPGMGYQKGQLIDDGVRAKIYGLMRIPLNVFVVVALSLTTEGDAHRDRVFLFCGGLLLAASIAAAYYLGNPTDQGGRQEVEGLHD